MKKLIALLMALAMIAALAACGTAENTDKETTKETTTENAALESTEDIIEGTSDEDDQTAEDTTTANDILDSVWGQYSDDQKPAIIGGHYSNEFTDAPATYELAYADELATMLMIPADQIGYVVDASTMVHLMNANSMTIGIVKLDEGTDMQAFADGVYETITNNQWMCGFPEKMIIAQVHEDYVLIAYGLTDLLDVFEGYLDSSWPVSDFYNEAIE